MRTVNNVTLAYTFECKLHSEITQLDYEIRVALPSAPVPKDGYPIIYVLDGHDYFPFARDVARLQSKRAEKTLVESAIVVGVGFPGDPEEVSKRRFLEFTAPAVDYIYPERMNRFERKEHGGAEGFLQFIQSELKPMIARQFTVHPERQTLFGHSLGGLFTAWVLFKQPYAFQNYLAISPSIWWNAHELYDYARDFLQQPVDRNLFLAVGELERFMVDDARELYRQVNGQINTQIYIAAEENHASVVPTVMSRAFRFALAPVTEPSLKN